MFLLLLGSITQLFVQGYDLGLSDLFPSLQDMEVGVRFHSLKTCEGHRLRIPLRCSDQGFTGVLDRRGTSVGFNGLTFRYLKITGGTVPCLLLVKKKVVPARQHPCE